jgi:hypothetical protein
MIQFNCIRTVLATVASVIFLAPAVSTAQGFPDRDAREISSYALTEAALAKYSQASANLGDLSKQVANNCDDSDSESASRWMQASLASMRIPRRRPPSNRRA